jgi:hypothetical protein
VCDAVFPALEFNFNLDLRIDILVWVLALPLVLGLVGEKVTREVLQGLSGVVVLEE